MVIGAPREAHRHEHRVGLTPFGVGRLVRSGHTVLIEKDAGAAAWFHDSHYQGPARASSTTRRKSTSAPTSCVAWAP